MWKMTREEAIGKVAALLRLAERGGTVAEAATAAAHAQAIMDRWELTHDAVNGHTDEQPETEEPIMGFGSAPDGQLDASLKQPRWMVQLAGGIARLNGCFIYLSSRWEPKKSRHFRSVEVVGRPSQVETVRYMYAWLKREIQKLQNIHGRGMTYSWRREFNIGAVIEILRRLEEQRRQTVQEVRAEYVNNPNALVRIDRSLARIQDSSLARAWAYEHFRFGKSRGGPGGQYHGSAREAGAAAAKSINLSRGAAGLGAGQKSLPGGKG